MLLNDIKTTISVTELKQLLHRLVDTKQKHIGIRVRMIGELWHQHHMRVLTIDEDRLSLLDESSNRLIFIQRITNIMQFEIDNAFQQYRPHIHYSVIL